MVVAGQDSRGRPRPGSPGIIHQSCCTADYSSELVFVLGIDPGLSRCGYGLVTREGSRLRAVAAGVATTPLDLDLPRRLAMLWADLTALLTDLSPDVVAVERVFFQTNVRTAMSVGQASGLALAAAALAGVEVVQYTANEVKQAVTGYGAAGKQQVARMVAALTGIDQPPRPPDATDALALAVCHLHGARLAGRVAAAQGNAQGAGAAAKGKVEGTGLAEANGAA